MTKDSKHVKKKKSKPQRATHFRNNKKPTVIPQLQMISVECHNHPLSPLPLFHLEYLGLPGLPLTEHKFPCQLQLLKTWASQPNMAGWMAVSYNKFKDLQLPATHLFTAEVPLQMEKLYNSGILLSSWSKQTEASLVSQKSSIICSVSSTTRSLHDIALSFSSPYKSPMPGSSSRFWGPSMLAHYRVKEDWVDAVTSAHPACPASHNLSLSQVFSFAWKN